jgi:hypothetical protein
MTFGAPEAEALYEGPTQKGFGVPSLALDGSPFPLGSTATSETTGLETLWIKKQSNIKQKNIRDNQQPSGTSGMLLRYPDIWVFNGCFENYYFMR